MKEPTKELLNDYMALLKSDAVRVFPDHEFVSIVVMNGKVSLAARYPDGYTITAGFDGATIAEERAL